MSFQDPRLRSAGNDRKFSLGNEFHSASRSENERIVTHDEHGPLPAFDSGNSSVLSLLETMKTVRCVPIFLFYMTDII
jgi:hypothetical protein